MLEPSRRRQPAVTRAQIIEAAIAAANDLGAGHFTLDAVVARLPVSKGALTHHFPSKLALLEAVLDHLAETFVGQVKAIAAADPNPYVRNARAYLRATVEGMGGAEDLSLARVVLIACLIEPALANRWTSHVAELIAYDPADTAGADDALIFRLIADGLWLSDVLGTPTVPPAQRQTLLHLFDPQLQAAQA